MTALKVLLVLALVLFLLGRVRVGGAAEYARSGLCVKIRVGRFWFQVYPVKNKKEEKEPPQEDKPLTDKKGGKLALLKDLLPMICEAAGALKERIRIDDLRVDFTAASADPARTALMFGGSSAVVGMLLPLIEQNFNVKERRVRTGMDFNAKEPMIYVYAAFSARVGQLVSFALRFGWKFLRVYRTNNMKKEAT